MNATRNEGEGINVFDMARQNEKDAGMVGEVKLRLEDWKKTRKRRCLTHWKRR